jgi:hypothetical protein
MSEFFLPSFSKDTPNKIGKDINVSGKYTLYTLIKTDASVHVAIADEPIDAKVNGNNFFCVRVDNLGVEVMVVIGFTPMETFDSNKEAFFGINDFAGCGMFLRDGYLFFPVSNGHTIIDREISNKAKEIIVILTTSNNGKKKKIRFLCDGNESESFDASEHLEGDFLFPAICLSDKNQQVTTIPIDQIEIRTPEIENLIQEYQEQRKNKKIIEELKLARSKLLAQNEKMMSDFFNQFEQQANASDVIEVEIETKKENEKEKKVKQVATKKTKKETKPKTTKATKKKEETKK